MDMFEKATRQKLRFNYRGSVSVEDLWDIPVKKDSDGNYYSGLNEIFCALDAVKEQEQHGLFLIQSKKDEILDLKINIVKHIVTTKIQEQKDRENTAAKAERKQKLLGILATKQDEELYGMSTEDLTKLING